MDAIFNEMNYYGCLITTRRNNGTANRKVKLSATAFRNVKQNSNSLSINSWELISFIMAVYVSEPHVHMTLKWDQQWQSWSFQVVTACWQADLLHTSGDFIQEYTMIDYKFTDYETILSNCSIKLFYQTILSTILSNYSIKRFYQTIQSNDSIKRFYESILSNDSFKLFYQTILSNYSIKLYYQTILSNYYIKLFYQTILSNPLIHHGEQPRFVV
jgi:hypothetical protein